MMRRNEMEVALLGVMAASSTGTALGIVPLPGSLGAAPSIYGQSAAIILWLGCIIAVIGVFWRDRLDGLVVEQFGLVGVMVGATMYAGALVTVNWLNAVLAIGMSLGVAVAAGVRYWSIYRYRRALRNTHGGKHGRQR